MYLNCHTYYSLRYGLISPGNLVKGALNTGARAIALTDINNSTAIYEFIYECGKNGIKPVAGIEFRNKNRLLYIGLAKNNNGLRILNAQISRSNTEKKEIEFPAPYLPDTYIIYDLENRPCRNLFDNEFIGIRPCDATRLISVKPDLVTKMVVLQPVTFSETDDFNVHKCLRAIDNNVLLSRLQREELANEGDTFIPIETIVTAFKRFPVILDNTDKILNNCQLDLNFKTSKNKKVFSSSRYNDKILLKNLALDGMKYRYGNTNKEAERRIIHELEIIDKLNFSAYFLITWDIIRYSISKGFWHVGRGSGANSIVAYCLKITNVDPIDLNLYFERFINPDRSSPPDFDIDYSWKERDEVISYIFKRYGNEHTSLLGTINTFQKNSIIRELGKIFGLPKEEIDMLAANRDKTGNSDKLKETVLSIGKRITGFPNMRSIHAGGLLISEEPITCYTALDMPPKGFQTTQCDMYTAEEIGFSKFDILSQRGIGHIAESREIILKNRSVSIDVDAIQNFKNDVKVKKSLRNGDTIGCFYVESPAMRGLLKKLKCEDYTTLVAASSIIRPGVAKSGMMNEYIYRFNNPDKFNYIHPVMKEQLEETFGIMVYQEDVLKVCHHFAGISLADSDILRRAMSGKFRSGTEMRRITRRFFENCENKGYDYETTKEVWRQIESFAGYSFSKAHSASYAVESFQSLWLKAHYPLEFMVAVINNFGGFYRTWLYVHEAKRCGAVIYPPCANHSEHLTTIYGKDIYMGFIHIAGMEYRLSNIIETARSRSGNYQSLSDFVERVNPELGQLVILIRSGAFRFTGRQKPELLWEAHILMSNKKQETTKQLFQRESHMFTLPRFEHNILDDAYDEIEYIGFPLSLSWFDLLETNYRGEITSGNLENHVGKEVRIMGYLVNIKYIMTKSNRLVNFGCFIDRNGDYFDTVHFDRSLTDWPFKGKGTYLILGKVVNEFGFCSIEVKKMAKMAIKKDRRY